MFNVSAQIVFKRHFKKRSFFPGGKERRGASQLKTGSPLCIVLKIPHSKYIFVGFQIRNPSSEVRPVIPFRFTGHLYVPDRFC